ncbi:hypothetical protein Dda_7325 [Drechslerella dactyloides]|uniref:F-box domain-containing protein n=1 Tax=Drechslerella dactyloides TaxID=74499 RepID=A0AAD6IS10_DREDA|nr:hypothetical protein Dda_7325 [Drechslerella dactyloides]
MSTLLALPNEILDKIIDQLVPSFADESTFSNHADWRKSAHIEDLRSLSGTCKHLSDLVRPHFYRIVVLDYPTCMIQLLRTLIENPHIREMVRTLAICCPLHYCNDIINPYSPRETFLDDNPELLLNMTWDTNSMDNYAAAVFRSVGLDRDEFKKFTEDELEALNDGSYWMSVPNWSERIGYETNLIQGLAVALIALSPRIEHLAIPRYHAGSAYHFENAVDTLARCEDTSEIILAHLTRLEVNTESIDYYRGPNAVQNDYLQVLLRIPAVKRLVDEGAGKRTIEKRDYLESLDVWESGPKTTAEYSHESDDAWQKVELKFPMTIFGKASSTVWISMNGLLCIDDPTGLRPSVPSQKLPVGPSQCNDGGCIPDTCLATLWSDLYIPANSATYDYGVSWTYHEPANRPEIGHHYHIRWVGCDKSTTGVTENCDQKNKRVVQLNLYEKQAGRFHISFAGMEDSVPGIIGAQSSGKAVQMSKPANFPAPDPESRYACVIVDTTTPEGVITVPQNSKSC